MASGLATIALCASTLSFNLARNSVNLGFLVGKAANFHCGDNIADALPYEAVTLKPFNLYTHRADTEEGKETERRTFRQEGVLRPWWFARGQFYSSDCEAYLCVCVKYQCAGANWVNKGEPRSTLYPPPVPLHTHTNH